MSDELTISKSDFLHYLNCPKSFWLRKREPNHYPKSGFSAFEQKLSRDGYEVERCVRHYFQKKAAKVEFQVSFTASSGAFARIDAIETHPGGANTLYEIKSSTSVKTTQPDSHIKDACYQMICAELAGHKINRVILIHLNSSYVKKGEINPDELLSFSDITTAVREIEAVTKKEIDEASSFLSLPDINREGCPCLYKPRAQHCETFKVFNPRIPRHSIYDLPRLSADKRAKFVSEGIFDLRKVPDNIELTNLQKSIVQSAKTGRPITSKAKIAKFLATLNYPIHFFDFETFASAVPIADELSPHKHLPFQYSLHKMQADGSIQHYEFLERSARLPSGILSHMQRDFSSTGSVVAWHASFEKTQLLEMAKWFPEEESFLEAVVKRLVDLEDVFKEWYVDAEFCGSTSIKNVLPVICRGQTYADLEVSNGSLAMDAWERMLSSDQSEADLIANSLLRYCERDTLAMVEIFKFLKNYISKN